MADGADGVRSTTSAIRELTERISQLELSQTQVLGRLDGLTTQVTTACSEMKSLHERVENHEQRILVREVAYRERIEPALDKLQVVATRLEVLAASVQRGAVSGGVIGGAGGAAGVGIVVGIIGKIAGWW